MTFNADGSQLPCAGATGEDQGTAHNGDAQVLLSDWESDELLKALRPEKKEVCTAWGVQFHPDGFMIASGGSRTGGFLRFWKPEEEEEEVAFHRLKFRQRAPVSTLTSLQITKRSPLPITTTQSVSTKWLPKLSQTPTRLRQRG